MATCPCCGANAEYRYLWANPRTCRICNKGDGHVHGGVQSITARGAYAGWWKRFWRRCKETRPHGHRHCSACKATWIEGLQTGPGEDYARGFADGVQHARKEMRP